MSALIVLLAAGATWALWLSSLPRPMLALAPIAAALALRPVARTPRGELLLRDDGSVGWVDLAGDESAVGRFDLQPRAALVTMRFDLQGVRRNLVLLPDTLGAQARRQLHLWRARHPTQEGDGNPARV